MRTNRLMLGVIGYLLLLVSCNNDLIIDTPLSKDAGLQICFNIPAHQIVRTRSVVADDQIDPKSVYVFVFDKDNKLVEYKNATFITTNSRILYYVNLAETDEYRSLYIVANAADLITFNASGWRPGITSLDNVKRDLLAGLNMANDLIVAMPSVHPMSGSMVFPSGYSVETTIGTPESPVLLTRATVKVKIVTTTDTDVEVIGANLANASVGGYVIAPPIAPETITVADYGTQTDGKDGMLGVPGNGVIDIYGYESPAENNTFVVLKARYKGMVGYYRINLTDAARRQYSLIRNHEYRVNINNISSPGYRTAAEAMVNSMSNNVIYDITVTDGYSHDVVTNGEYYLGLSNGEFIIYGDEALVNEPIAVVTHNAPATVWQGTASVVASEGGTATVNNPFGISTGFPQPNTLNITMSENVTSVTVFLQVGNLTRTIRVKRWASIGASGGVITDFDSKEHVVAEVTPNDGWLWVSASKNNAGRDIFNVVNPSGGIYINVENRTGSDHLATNRKGHLYIARSNDKGRIKVTVIQE